MGNYWNDFIEQYGNMVEGLPVVVILEAFYYYVRYADKTMERDACIINIVNEHILEKVNNGRLMDMFVEWNNESNKKLPDNDESIFTMLLLSAIDNNKFDCAIANRGWLMLSYSALAYRAGYLKGKEIKEKR